MELFSMYFFISQHKTVLSTIILYLRSRLVYLLLVVCVKLFLAFTTRTNVTFLRVFSFWLGVINSHVISSFQVAR